MHRIMLLVISAVFLTGCAGTSMRSTLIKSGLVGCAGGAPAGYFMAPEPKENRLPNGILGCLVGGGVTMLVGAMLHKNDPTNKVLQERVNKKANKQMNGYEIQGASRKLTVFPKFNMKNSYKVPTKNLPKHLQGKVPQGHLTVHEVKEQRIHENGETIIIEPHKAYIYSINKGQEDE